MAMNTTPHYLDSSDGKIYQQQGTGGASSTSLATLISGEDQTNDVLKIEAQFNYEVLTPNATTTPGTGAVGDYLHSVIVTVATGTIVVNDAAVAVLTIPAGSVGVWSINALSVSGAWNFVSANAADRGTAIGRFTA